MLKNIFTPIKIGSMELPNRLVVAPMVVNYCNTDGTATKRYTEYHEAKAKGGWGLIITEDYAVDPKGKGFPNIPGLWDDKQTESHRAFTESIHRYNCKIAAQIYHAGRQTSKKVIGTEPVAPSPIPCPALQEIPRELNTAEIHEIVGKFGDCALRAKMAGFDAIEVHGAHGYLIAEFMSPYSNKRNDEYGGNLMNRIRFPLEIIANIRLKAGDDYPIIFRISGDEFVPGGRSIEDTKAICIMLESAGVDALHVSAGVYGSWYTIVPPYTVKHGWLADFSCEVKKVVKIPVITVGRINDPLIAEAIIASGKADIVAMGRASLADPELPNKALRGDFAEINHCTGCMQGCVENCNAYKPVKCVVNPRLGRESEFEIKHAAIKRKIMVLGGGPAGMESAIVAAQRGHDVYLFEKSDRLGGQYYLASIPMWKGEIASFIAWQRAQLNKYGVKVFLNTTITENTVKELGPDVVIVATGSKPVFPGIPGIESPYVHSGNDVLAGRYETGKDVAIIGGGMIGTETALHLYNHGKNVTLIELVPEVAKDEPKDIKHFIDNEIKNSNIKIFVNSSVKKIEENGSIIIEINGEKKNIGRFDSIVVAVGLKPANNNEVLLKNFTEKVIVIGDALKVRKALDAIEEGYEVGLNI